MIKRCVLLALSLLVLIGLAGARPAGAQTPQPSDDDVNRVAKQLYCPVCENVPLDVCPTQACADWRAEIRARLAQGWTDDEIKAYFAQQYGDRVLARPPARGLSLLVYLVPPLAIGLGGLVLIRFLRRNQRLAPAAPASTNQPSPAASEADYEARLERELKERL